MRASLLPLESQHPGLAEGRGPPHAGCVADPKMEMTLRIVQNAAGGERGPREWEEER
jgi:hypothetical protein